MGKESVDRVSGRLQIPHEKENENKWRERERERERKFGGVRELGNARVLIRSACGRS